jgi:hypothetical protein
MEPQRQEPLTDENIHEAVRLWCMNNEDRREIRYGDISTVGH